MPKRLTLIPHLSRETLEQRYREATDAIARTHSPILWLLAKAKTTEQVAEVSG